MNEAIDPWDTTPAARLDEPAKTVEPTVADEVSDLARHGDPSKRDFAPEVTAETERLRRGIVWMRPTELIPQTTARIAGRGIDFQAELARRARSLPVQTAAVTRRAIRDRSSALPPLSSFGVSTPQQDGPQHAGPGL